MYTELTKKYVFEQLNLAVVFSLTVILPVKKCQSPNSAKQGGE